MELKHHFVVPSSLEDTWHSFNQLEDIAPCFPGATLTSVSGEQFTGTVKVKLGPIAMIYTGTGEFLERNQETHTVVISATGKDKRGNGTAGADRIIPVEDLEVAILDRTRSQPRKFSRFSPARLTEIIGDRLADAVPAGGPDPAIAPGEISSEGGDPPIAPPL